MKKAVQKMKYWKTGTCTAGRPVLSVTSRPAYCGHCSSASLHMFQGEVYDEPGYNQSKH